MAKKKGKKEANINEDLKGFDIKINEFGEIIRNKPIDDLNEFLDENVEDKKLNKAKDTTAEEE